MDVSVIIVNWNTRELLLQCLDSVLRSLKRIEVEAFVVDNGSNDGSIPSAKERFPTVRFIENKANVGFAKANNQAMELAQGRYLLLLNPDTLVKEGAIEKMVSFMDNHPEAGIAGPQLLSEDGSKQNSIANFPSLATELLNKNLLRQLFPETYPGKERDYTGPIEVDSVVGACMIVRRDAVKRVGSLDEDYFLFLEETDWCYRMKRGGWKIYHVPDAEIYHFQGKAAAAEKERARVEYYRSRYLFFRKNRGGWQWFLLLLGVMVRLPVELSAAFVVCAFTLFSSGKWRKKLAVYAYLTWWHLKGCPEGMGLRK